VYVSVCILYWLNLNDLAHVISLIFYTLCACYAIFVVRVFFAIKGHIVSMSKIKLLLFLQLTLLITALLIRNVRL